MRFEVETKVVPYAPRSAFERKWGLSGYTTPIKDGAIRVCVSYASSLPSPLGGDVWINRGELTGGETSVATALGHEIGHSTQVANGARLRQMSNDERFEFEVEAWLLEFPLRSLDYIDATLMLDALNTYRRGYDVTDGEWQAARVRVDALCNNPTIREYVPLEPDFDDEAMPCAGAGGGEGGEGEGEEGDGGDEHGHGGEGEGGTNDAYAQRDEFLHSIDGVRVAKTLDWEQFGRFLDEKHWPKDKLPAVTKSIKGMR